MAVPSQNAGATELTARIESAVRRFGDRAVAVFACGVAIPAALLLDAPHIG
jgi:hypothetical protein